MDIHEIIGWIAVGIYVIGILPYFWDTLYGKTRPNRVTWFGWTLLTMTSAIIQTMQSADASVLVIYTAATTSALIFILSLYRGVTIFSFTDAVSLILGGSAYVLWLILDAPGAALVVNIIADFLFGVPTFIKAWKMSESESKTSWFIGSVSMGIALVSKTKFDFINTAFPLYLFLLNTTVFIFITGFLQRCIQRTQLNKQIN